MTKSARRTTVASVLILAFAAYIYFFEFKKGEDAEKKKDLDTLLVSGVTIDQVTHIEWWTGPNKTQVADKAGDVWNLEVPLKDRASTERIKNFLSKFLQVRALDTVAQGTFDEKTFGLDMPMYEVKITATGAGQRVLHIGSVKAYDASLYVQLDDEKLVRLAPNSLLDLLRQPPADYRERTIYREPLTKSWAEITVKSAGKTILLLKRAPKKWSAPDDAKLKIDTDAVDAYLKRIESIKAIDFAFEGSGRKELHAFHLDQPYFLVQLKAEDGSSWELRLSKAKAQAADSAAGAMQASVAASATGFPAIARILDQTLKIIDKRAEDFERAPKGK